MKDFMEVLRFAQMTVVVFCDSQGAIHLSKHQMFHERSKHIDVRLHFVREIIKSGAVIVVKINTEDNPADTCTQVILSKKF